MEATRTKAKMEVYIFTNRRKGVLKRKPVSTTTGKRKRSEEDIVKRPRTSSKSNRTKRTLGSTGKRTSYSKTVIASFGKKSFF